jgi:hypothetical protein
LSPLSQRILPMSSDSFMHLLGVVEMIVGLAIFTKWTRVGAYIASAWLVAIAVQLLTSGAFFDLAVRDVEVAISAFILARLTEARESAFATDEMRHDLHGGTAHRVRTI